MADTQEVRSVLVTNISPSATEKTVSDFFSFCGKISKLYLRKEEGKDTSAAVIQFETESAAKTALLLTNALIVDRPITVTTYLGDTNPSNSPNVNNPSDPGVPVDQANITNKNFGDISDDQRSKTSVVASLLAAGYVLAENALEKAKEIDEKTNFSKSAQNAVNSMKAKAKEIDVQYGISDKATAVKNSISETAKKVDTELGLSEKASAAANVIKTTAQTGLQKIEQNPTVQKGMESVKSTAQKVSTSVNQTFNDLQSQTRNEIEVERRAHPHPNTDSTATTNTTSSTIPAPTTTTTTTTSSSPVSSPTPTNNTPNTI